MRGRPIPKTWQWNPALIAPARYRRACRYEAFVPPPPEHLASLLADLCDAVMDDSLPPLVQAAVIHASLKRSPPSMMETAVRGVP